METRQNGTLHIKVIYQESEQQEIATCKKYLQVQISKKTISGQNSIAHPTELSNEIIVNIDGNYFIVVFKAKYPVRTPANYRFYIALAALS